MKNNGLGQIKHSRKLSFLTFLGYLWVSITVYWTIADILNATMFLIDNTTDSYKWLWALGLAFIAVLTAVLLHLFFPALLEIIFNRSSEEKNLGLTSDEENKFNLLFINSCISNEMISLDIIRKKIDDMEFEDAYKFGLWSSNLFLRIGDHFTRVVNGLYTLLALNSLYNKQKNMDGQRRLLYSIIKTKIDCLCWSYSNLSPEQIVRLKRRLNKQQPLNDQFAEFFSNEDLKTDVEKIRSRLNELHSDAWNAGFIDLSAHALRQILNICSEILTPPEYQNTCSQFGDTIKAIKNTKDKNTFEAHLLYHEVKSWLKAITSAPSSYTESAFTKHLSKAQRAQKLYQKSNDTHREVKCYQLLGTLHQTRAEHLNDSEQKRLAFKNAYNSFLLGVQESLRIVRYDTLLANYLSLANKCITINESERLRYICDGYEVAKNIGNQKKIISFEKLLETRHLLLVRHAESKKNLSNTLGCQDDITEKGKYEAELLSKKIKTYLNERDIDSSNITIYSPKYEQASNTALIVQTHLGVEAIQIKDDLLPINLGQLSSKREADLVSDTSYIQLQKWKTNQIAISDISISNAEDPNDFWDRIAHFSSEHIENQTASGCDIVFCTSSVAMALARYYVNRQYSAEGYKSVEFPTCGVLHFKRTFDDNYEMCKDNGLTNLSTYELSSLTK